MRRISAALLIAIAASGAAFAQEAPTPMPRPLDRLPEGAAPESGGTRAIDLGETLSAAEAVEALISTPQPVTLQARITEDGAAIPDGVVWRVFDTRTDTSGELALAAKSTDATASLSLAPGEYVVHVAYGRAQASDSLVVAPGENIKSIVLDAGALRLNAAISGEFPIPINMLRFDVYAGDSENARELVAEALSSNEILTLNAGTYHVVSRFGAVNAVVRADLRVEPGEMTDATLYHRAGQVMFKLVSEPGGDAIADIEWTVKTAEGETVFTDLGAFPSTVLAEGDYLVLAKRGEDVFNREFQVQPGPSREIEVLTTVY